MNRIVVIGSINVDNILQIQALPQPGETISMDSFSKAPGGKGANQAVAAARAGAQTSFIGRVGDDDNGQMMLRELASNHINTDQIQITNQEQTGQAYILLQNSGQNSIIVQRGANFALTAEDVIQFRDTIEQADFVIAQFETPIAATIAAFEIAHQAGKKTILNPAPAQAKIPDALLELTDIIIPNETESELITGIAAVDEVSLAANAKFLHDLGIECVIITLGSTGSYISYRGDEAIVPAFKTQAIDTTAAGDTFIGALASELNADLTNIEAAVIYASMSSSFTVQTLGAFPSIPWRETVSASLEARQ
ncbi:ribokinase [Lacticaseibacillus saniviri]|nr:ribokinase [Lacticaseibacillus saniviri]